MRFLVFALLILSAVGCGGVGSADVDDSTPVSPRPQSAIESATSSASCGTDGLALQVLGSGGPFARDDRASSAYLVWIDGRARVLIDAGGGAFVRFGAAGARIEDLRLIGISHFHPDHVSDLPAVLWGSGNFRSEPLAFIGPKGDEVFPGAADLVTRLFDGSSGVFPILSGTVGGERSGFPLVVTEIDTEAASPSIVLDDGELTVSALGVPHNAPALGFRVESGGFSVVLGSDQTGTDPSFVEFARDASVLVMHLAVSESAGPNPVHGLPSVVGQVAQNSGVDRLVLSHFIGVEPGHARFDFFSLGDLPGNVATVREHYEGEVVVASDLMCVAIGGD